MTYKNTLNKWLFLTFLVIFQGVVSYSQNGSITGIVKDKKTSETIVGANVILQGTTTGSSTDLNGEFTIANIKKGTYNVVVSFISYKTLTIENVKVIADRPVTLTVELEESIASIEGVVVSARRMTNTDVSLITSMKNTDVVLSGITAQQISKSQDRDASEVVRRVPGVTVVENRFIMVRGLSERYSSVLLNDAQAPGMEPDVRSFSFDIVPSSLIERVLIFKSPSADLPGDFAGGVVKVFTKSIPDETGIEAGVNLGYKSGTTFGNFKQQPGGAYSWTGLNNGKYDLPASFPSNLRNENPASLIVAGRSLPNIWIPETFTALPNRSAYITGTLRFKIKSVQIGNITSITYSNSLSHNDIKRIDYNQYDELNQRSSVVYAFNDEQFTHTIKTGILHNWAFRINPGNTIEFRNLFNQLSVSQYILRSGIHYDFGYVPDNHSFDLVYRGIYTGQLSGKHEIIKDRLTADWVAAYSGSYRDEPDYRRYRSDVDTIENTKTLYIPVGAAASYFLGRFYSSMDEGSYSAGANLTFRAGKTNTKPGYTVKAGFLYETKDRSFEARNIGYTVANTTTFNWSLLNVTIDSLFSTENINNTTGIRIDEQSNPSDSYTASNRTSAAYVSLSMPVGRKISAIAGVRVEDNLQALNSYTLTNKPVRVNNLSTDVLPSLNISYNFSMNMLVRVAYGITMNRPEFRELAPFGFYDFNYNLVKKGNENLKNATIHNFDIRWEMYPSASEIVTAGVFYKHFNDPIETLFIPGGGSGGIKDFSYGNAESATSMGMEVEIRKSLAGLSTSRFVEDLTVLFNTSFIISRIVLGESAVRQSDKRPMQGQSPYIINLGLFYKNMKSNFQANIQYNTIGKRIFAIGYDVYPDIYEMPRNLLDITVTKGIGRHFEVKAGISDLLNNTFLLLQDANQDGRFDRKKDQIIQSYSPGSTINAGLSYKF